MGLPKSGRGQVNNRVTERYIPEEAAELWVGLFLVPNGILLT